jgi:hypothetical protein
LEIVIVIMLLQFGSMNQITDTQKIGHSPRMGVTPTHPLFIAGIARGHRTLTVIVVVSLVDVVAIAKP